MKRRCFVETGRRLVAAAVLAGAMIAGASAMAQEVDIPQGADAPTALSKLAYVRIVVPDIDKAVAFYTKGVGMTKSARPNPEPGEVVMTFGEDVTQKNAAIGLILVKGGPVKSGNLVTNGQHQYQDGKKFGKLVFALSDPQRAFKRAKFRELQTQANADNTRGYITEPTGNLIEIIPMADLPDKPTTHSLTRITFAKLISRDFIPTGDFFGNVLGMTEFGSYLHKQRVRELVFTYRSGGVSNGVINSLYNWDYAETIHENEREFSPRFVMDILGDPVEFAKTAAALTGRTLQGSPVYIVDTGGNVIEVLKARTPAPAK